MKAYWRTGGIVLRILDLGTRLRLVVSFTPRPLYTKKKPLVPIGLETLWAAEPLWTCPYEYME
jgi:hypothetical protein